MKTVFTNTRWPKVCHAQPGDLISPCDPVSGEPADAVYMVCVNRDPKHFRTAQFRGFANGLYAEGSPLFMVNVANGEASPLPHLSSRARIMRGAELHIDPTDGVLPSHLRRV